MVRQTKKQGIVDEKLIGARRQAESSRKGILPAVKLRAVCTLFRLSDVPELEEKQECKALRDQT